MKFFRNERGNSEIEFIGTKHQQFRAFVLRVLQSYFPRHARGEEKAQAAPGVSKGVLGPPAHRLTPAVLS